jgi:hypothetical protein
MAQSVNARIEARRAISSPGFDGDLAAAADDAAIIGQKPAVPRRLGSAER